MLRSDSVRQKCACAGYVLPSRPSPCRGLSPPLSTRRDKTPQPYPAGCPCDSTSPLACRVFHRGASGSSIVPCPGFPFRASGAVYHLQDVPRPGASGASQVLRRLSSCMPRPEDSGGPAHPRQLGWARVAFGSVKTLGVRHKPCRSCTSTSGCAVTPTAYRIRCRRFAHLVRRDTSRLRHGRKTRYGWVARPYPTGTFTLQETPSFLGAITPGFRRRGREGPCSPPLPPELTITHNFCELRERPKGQIVDNKKGAADNKL